MSNRDSDPTAQAAAVAHWDGVIAALQTQLVDLQAKLAAAQAVRKAMSDPTLYAQLAAAFSPGLPIVDAKSPNFAEQTSRSAGHGDYFVDLTFSSKLAKTTTSLSVPRSVAYQRIFHHLISASSPLTIREISEGTGINRNTVYDVLLTSHRDRFVRALKEGSKKITTWRIRRPDEPEQAGQETVVEDEE
jgi:hypothetical protein